MKPRYLNILLTVSALLSSQLTYAASDSWDGSTDGAWATSTNWLTDPATVPGAGEIATFNGLGNGNTTISLDLGVTIGTIVFDTASAAAYTIGSGGVGNQILTLSDTGAVTMNSTVTNNEIFNANLVLGTGIAGTTSITNSTTLAGAKTLSFAGTVQGGTGGAAGIKTVNVFSASGSSVNFTNAITPGGASAINLSNSGTSSTGTVTLSGNVNSSFGTLRSTGGGTLVVDGQNVTVASSSSYGGGSTANGKFEIKSGSVSFNGGLTMNSSDPDGSYFKVSGGTFNASSITMVRTQAFTTLQTSPSISTGFLVTNGTATVTGNLNIAGSNSSATGLVSGGTLTVGGEVQVGNSTVVANGRFNVFQVSGGTFSCTDTTNGIVLGRSATSVNNGEFILTGTGTSTVEKISFGISTSVANCTGALIMNGAGASLYLGSGGIVKTTTNAFVSTINLTAGILGAKADWSSALAMSLTGTGMTIKAADALNAAHNIALTGVLSGSNGFTKTGLGTLTLGGANTYTGSTTVSEGSLILADDAQLRFAPTTPALSKKVTGSGSATFDGDFNFDLTGADLTNGNAWTVVDVTSKTFSSSFSVVGFTAQGDGITHTMVSGSNTWTFSEATGVLSLAVSTSAYSSWASTNGLTVTNNGATQDPDADGIQNELEFVLGGNPLASSTSVLPTATDAGTNFIFTFLRNDASEAEIGLAFQYGSTLSGWTPVVIGTTTGNSGPEVAVSENTTAPDTIIVTIPKGTNTKLFGRLQAVK